MRKYGWVKDHQDDSDKLYRVVAPRIASLPKKVDLHKGCSPVEDQQDLGSCTANALAANLEFLEIKDKLKYVDLSRLFIYYYERFLEGTIKEDAGAEIRDGIKALARFGVCHESLWPYKVGNFTKKPNATAQKNALKHQITSYFRITTLLQMKTCLADGFPFVFGFNVYESFESDAVATTGIMPMPKENEELLGGHAVCAVGYDDKKKAILVRNSWGTEWGMNGYFTMPYEFISNKTECADFWTIRRGEGV
jgi:C1A family cysteine protease